MSNDLMTAEQMQNALGRLTLTTQSVVEMVGVVQNTLTDHEKRLMKNEEDYASLRNDFEAEKAIRRDRERIEADEVNNITQAIKNRVRDILSDVDRFDRFGRFTAKCRNDAQRYSYYRGRNAVDTKRMYYAELLEYIGNWTPEGFGGVAGYLNHLDGLPKGKS